MKYNIIKEYSLADLLERVNKDMKDGWKPQGGIAVDHEDSMLPVFYQAMIK